MQATRTRRSPRHRFIVAALCSLVFAPSASAQIQPQRPPAARSDMRKSLLDYVHREVDGLHGKHEPFWREYFTKLRSRGHIEPFVEELISFQQKARIGMDFAGGNTHQRIRKLFCQRVADPREVVELMNEQLRQHDARLYEHFDKPLAQPIGLNPEKIRPILYTAYGQPHWQNAFDRAVDAAAQAAQKDVARFVATCAASGVVTDGIRDASIEAGIWGPEEQLGTWRDSLAKIALGIFVDAALDTVTDPTDTIIGNIQNELAAAERAIVDGPNGYLATLKRITDSHKAVQTRLVYPKN